jgi:ribosomal protein S18 acetylase RimI-like enzyme
MKLRPATAADTPFLRRLHHRVYRDVVTRQFGSWDESAQDGWFEKGLGEAEFSVIEENGEPIGALALKDSSDRIELVELQILPEHQSRGLGSALLRGQIERAQTSGRLITLRVLLENRARALYERHGFVVSGRTDTHYLMEWEPCEGRTPPR